MKYSLTKRHSNSGPAPAALTAGIHYAAKPLMAVLLMLLMAASASAQVQYGRPTGTVSAGNWTAVGAATLHGATNEVTPSNAEYAENAQRNSVTPAELSLTSLTDPNDHTGHWIRFRLKGAGGTTCNLQLYQGTTLIASLGATTAPGSFTLYQYNLSTAEAAAITDYTNLRLHIVPGSMTSKTVSVQVSWMEFQCPSGIVPQEMNVYYQTTPAGDIPHGDITPSAAEGTDYGDVLVSSSLDRTYTIKNTGGADLTIGTVTVPTSQGFSLLSAPASTVTGGGTTTFTIRFTPASTGLKSGTVSIVNNDSNENPYNFAVQGNGTVPVREMNVYYQSTPTGDIADGDSSPSAAEGNEFGNVGVFTNLDHTFTIQNTGNADLNLTDASPYVIVTGTDFSLITPYPSTPVASGGGTTTFTVRFSPSSQGQKTGTVSIANDDSNENPYNFDIQGTGTVSPPTVENPQATSITESGAILGGEVTAINASTIVERGVYWSTTQGFTPPGQGTKVSETGTFPAEPFTAAPLTGLSSGQAYYFKAFAINNIGWSGYTAEATFYTEAATQPTNLQFSAVDYIKMTIGWNPGSGDGVIVLAKEGSAVDVGSFDPVDGTAHAYNSDFSLATDLGNGNKVVYRGPANQFTLTGLSSETTYHVAVYEYAGSGTSINYQQDAPLQGSQATIAVYWAHNYLHNIQCDQCHAMHTGADLVARDAAQEAICKTCHNSTQMAGNESKWKVGMHEITNVDTRTIDCGSCHDVHRYDFNTTDTHAGGATAENQKWIRHDTSKYVAGALEPALFQFDTSVNTDHYAFSDDLTDPPQQTGAPFNGICQTCHTSTSLQWHTNSNQATEAKPHNHHKGTAPNNPNCMACHSHAAGFPTPTCFSCHSASQDNGDNLPPDSPGPAGRRPVWGEFALNSHHAMTAVEEADCLVCHDQTTHMDGYVVLKNADTGALITESTSGGFRKVNQTQTDINALNTFCISCHDADDATQKASPSDPFGDGSTDIPEKSLHSNVDYASDRVEAVSTVGCIQCHEGHGSANLSIIDDESVLTRPGATTGPVVFTAITGADSADEVDTVNTQDADDLCATCHIGTMVNHTGGNHTASVQGTDERGKDCSACHPHGSSSTTFKGFMPPAGGAATCDTCHAAGGAADGGPNNLRPIFGTGGDLLKTSMHPALTENDCRVCHLEPDSNHMDANGKIDLKMADGGTYSFTTFAPVAMQNNICLPCHDADGASATWGAGDGTSALRPWSGSTRDVPNTYDQFDTLNDSYHPVRGGTGTPASGITANTMVAPWNTNLGTQTMTCFNCHDTNAHASDYQRFIPVENPNSPGNFYGIDFAWFQSQDGLLARSSSVPTPPESLASPMATYPQRMDVYCMKCHKPDVYVYNGSLGTGFNSNTSIFEYHGAAQSGHGSIGSSNNFGCFGCHGGFIEATGGNNVTNGDERGGIHGKSWDWELDGGLNFASGDWVGSGTGIKFLYGGWLSGWATTPGAGGGQCSGGACNHGSISRGGSKTYNVP